jgi:hypothetical protein
VPNAPHAASITVVDPTTIPDWDEQVLALAGATFFHTAAWAQVLMTTYGHVPFYLVARRDSRITEALPLMEVNSWLTGHRGVCLPFTDVCGPVGLTADTGYRMPDATCRTPDGGQNEQGGSEMPTQAEACAHRRPEAEGGAWAGEALWQAAVDLGRQRRWKTLEIRDPRCPFGPILEPETGTRSPGRARCCPFVEHVLDISAKPCALPPQPPGCSTPKDPQSSILNPQSSILLHRLDSGCRRAIRKAEQSGVTCERRTDLEAVREFYRLHCLTRRKHGAPPQPFRFFENLHRHAIARGHGCVMLGKHESRVVAANVYLYTTEDRGPRTEAIAGARTDPNTTADQLRPEDSKKAESRKQKAETGRPCAFYKFGASDSAWQHLRASNLVMWEAIRWLSERGCDHLHFGRTSISNEGLCRFKRSFGAKEAPLDYARYDLRAGHRLPVTDRSEGWQARVFRALPLAVNRWAGAALYRHLD